MGKLGAQALAPGMTLAEGLARLDKEAHAFQVLLAELKEIVRNIVVPLAKQQLTTYSYVTYSAIEAQTVIVVVQGLDPPVTCFNRKATSHAFGSEEFVPICFEENHYF